MSNFNISSFGLNIANEKEKGEGGGGERGWDRNI
jgi:hypothetical protein